jgi:hypothetical protein
MIPEDTLRGIISKGQNELVKVINNLDTTKSDIIAIKDRLDKLESGLIDQKIEIAMEGIKKRVEALEEQLRPARQTAQPSTVVPSSEQEAGSGSQSRQRGTGNK